MASLHLKVWKKADTKVKLEVKESKKKKNGDAGIYNEIMSLSVEIYLDRHEPPNGTGKRKKCSRNYSFFTASLGFFLFCTALLSPPLRR